MKMDEPNRPLPILKATQPEESPPRRYTPWPPEREGERGLDWDEACEEIERQAAPATPWWLRFTRRDDR